MGKKERTPPAFSQLKSKHLYSLLDYLHAFTFCDRRLTSTEIVNDLKRLRSRRRDDDEPKDEWQAPPKDAIRDLLDNTPDPSELKIHPMYLVDHESSSVAQKRKMNRTLSFIDGFAAGRNLVSYRIVRRNKEGISCLALDDDNHQGFYFLTYPYSPDMLGLEENIDYTSDDYLHQVSARWQLFLDLIYAFPYIRSKDANALHRVLRNHHTLGEIPERIDRDFDDDDKESIDFNLLANILSPLHKAYKRQCINGENLRIPLMEFTMGAYNTVREDKPCLGKADTIRAYPLCTRIWNGIPYLAVRIQQKKDDAVQFDYLRIDHILDCESLAGPRGKNTLAYNELGTPPGIEQVKYGANQLLFELTNCRESALNEIIDTFGKSCISSARKEEDLWSFNIKIPERRKELLDFLHNAEYITPVETVREKNDTGLDVTKYNLKLKAITEHLMENVHPAKVSLPDGISSDCLELIRAIRENNEAELNRLLDQWTGPACAEDIAWLRYIALPLNSVLYQRILDLGQQPGPLAVELPYKDIEDDSIKTLPQYLTTAAAYYDYDKSLELLLKFDDPIQETLAAAIDAGSTNCLNYLLTHHRESFFTLNEEGHKTLAGNILVALAHAGQNEKVSTGCKLVAETLLDCQFIDGHYEPHPECIALNHIAYAQNRKLLNHYLRLLPDLQTRFELPDFDAMLQHEWPGQLIEDAKQAVTETFKSLEGYALYPWFGWTARARTAPDEVIDTMLLLPEKISPFITENEYFKTILLTAALSKPSPAAYKKALPLLNKLQSPIVIQDDFELNAQTSNWFGDKGFLQNWKSLAKDLKTPLTLAFNRDSDIPCDPNRINRKIIDTVLSKFEIVGNAPKGKLSKLATYALKYASVDKITESKLLEGEDTQVLINYCNCLEELSLTSSARSEKIIALLKSTIKN